MAKVFERIDEELAAWVAEQRMFFVATAPSDEGHVNVSPKAPIDSLRVLGPTRVAYLDFLGSGVETVAHLRDDGRIVVMLCAFEGPPRIVRFHGRGTVLRPGDEGFDELAASFGFDDRTSAKRCVVVVDCDRISDACGFGVPLMRYEGERRQADGWIDAKLRMSGTAPDDYRRARNAVSIDGLPGADWD